ncbi:hypothetical protein O181_015807 [Austropuccinia psidii MF-1]|uniref:RNase H type-1 domain-containing protein n=1 Tax=Austropuccinia psidii MF-1 TaxID=1389203 RepID=A0A9Q3C2S9_9BASI|nr:hypothetical protein [Austropuccinia psidii MF-1]
MNDYVSQPFNTPNSLPQGLPLLVTLYLIYNTSLLRPTPLTLDSKAISIAYIDNVVHLKIQNDTVHINNQQIQWLGVQLTNRIALPQKSNPSQAVIVKRYEKLRSWSPTLPARLLWCPGHSDIPQNERADQLAKEATQTRHISKFTQQIISILKLKQHTKQHLKAPTPLTQTQQQRMKFNTPAALIIEGLDKLKKGLAATSHQLRTGLVSLNDHLHRIKRMDKPICETCNTNKTPSHHLITCKKFRTQRKDFLEQTWKKRLRINPQSAKSSLDNPQCYPLLTEFILSTAPFSHIKNYTIPLRKYKKKKKESDT